MVFFSLKNKSIWSSSPTSGANFMLMYWVYILQNPAGKFYIGQTDDLSTRLANHNRTDETDGKFTPKNGPWTIVWSESHPTRSAAMQRERQIKRMKSSRWIRETLLNGGVPTRRD
jgi:putative endonuclease